MDLGVVGLDGLVGGSDTTTSSGFGSCSDPEAKHKWYGSGFLKQERSEDDDCRSSKLAKTSDADNGDISASKAMLLRSNATLFSDSHHHQHQHQMMLSFSSPSKPEESPNFSVLDNKNSSPNATLLPYAYHHHPLSISYTRNTGCYSSSGSSSMVHGGYGGGRGPFTPSQWMELEHQALIYKYITANVPIPSNLLIPIRKALDSAGLYNFSTGFLRPNALGWGGFHLGFSNNTDPEPGRCRRTDGKKWRCSRDAVVDQKYCERHMNRGRHRSRKPVEGQSGHALTGATTTTATTTTNTTPNGSKLNTPNGNSASSSLAFAEPKNMHNLLAPDNNTSAAASTINRMFMNNKENNNASERMQDGPALPMLPPTLELKPKESHPFMLHKQEINPYDESSSSRNNNEFGLVTCDSLLNPSQKSPTLLDSRSYGSSQNPANRDAGSQHSLRHFIDDCPKTQSNHRSGGVSWPELDMQSDRTQLSISLPMTSSDFMSFTTSSPTNEKLTLSPLRLSRELDPIQMGLGVGSALNNESNTSTTNTTTRQANWIPITWESSMGGPLGEVLNLSTNNNNYNNAAASDDHCASSALNLMSDGWDNSPPMGSSPTGVLQKTAFGSLSNSSAGSSPRGTDNKTQELCNDLLG